MIKSRANPPKGSYSDKFNTKWDEYYKKALDKAKLKFTDLSNREIKKIFSLKEKGYTINEISTEFNRIFDRKISKSEVNKLLEERSKAAIVVWSIIKHKFEKSEKSGRWIPKKKKK